MKYSKRKCETKFKSFLKSYMENLGLKMRTPEELMQDEEVLESYGGADQLESAEDLFIYQHYVEDILTHAKETKATIEYEGNDYYIVDQYCDAGNITAILGDENGKSIEDEDGDQFELDAFAGFEYYAYEQDCSWLHECEEFLKSIKWK